MAYNCEYTKTAKLYPFKLLSFMDCDVSKKLFKNSEASIISFILQTREITSQRQSRSNITLSGEKLEIFSLKSGTRQR